MQASAVPNILKHGLDDALQLEWFQGQPSRRPMASSIQRPSLAEGRGPCRRLDWERGGGACQMEGQVLLCR